MIRKTSTYLRYFWEFAVLFVLGCLLYSCGNPTEADARLDAAEKLMEEAPDSSLTIIGQIDTTALTGDSRKARYALLKSQAMDRNYIDTTTFAILQPALDYYLRKGTPAQKLKTLYYKARIYQNRQEEDTAMTALLKARDLIPLSSDTLMNAMVFQNLASLYFRTFEIDEAIKANIEAYRHYNKLSYTEDQLRCLTNALEGTYILHDKELGDSLLQLIKTVTTENPEFRTMTFPYIFRFPFFFGTEKDRRETIGNLPPMDSLPYELRLDIAEILCDNGNPELGKIYFDSIDPESDVAKTGDYGNIRPFVLEMNGDYKAALEAYKEQMQHIDDNYRHLITQNVLFAEQKYNLDKEKLKKKKEKDDIILSIAILCVAVIALAFVYYYRNRYHKSRLRAEEEKRKAEEEKLRAEEERTARLEIENEKQVLVMENLKMKVDHLREERDGLKELLADAHAPENLRNLIRERLDILNKFLVPFITEQKISVTEQQKLLQDLTMDSDRFLKENQQVFQALYPGFISYLLGKGLTDQEIGYCCLWALGLRSKEIGRYLDIVSYNRLSAQIRKKLGLEEGKTYLPAFLRSLLDKESGNIR